MRILLAIACLSGCRDAPSKTQQVADEPVEAKVIGETGAMLDAPKSWVVTADGKISYRVGLGPNRQVFVNEIAFAPASPDELAIGECPKTSTPTKETLPSGAFAVQCTAPAAGRDGTSVTLHRVVVVARAGDKHVKCYVQTPSDPTKLAAICRSLRDATSAGTPGSAGSTRDTVGSQGGS